MGKSLIIKGADFSANAVVADFVRLDWIGASTSATSHIDSGIFWGDKVCGLDDELQFAITLDASITQSDLYSMGARVNTNTYCNVWFAPTQTSFSFGNASVQYRGTLLGGGKHTVSLNKNGGYIDGTAYLFQQQPTPWSGSSSVYDNIPIYLDCSSKSSGNTYLNGAASLMKIHWVKYFRGATLLLDAIPVRRAVDNIVCLYDKVSGQYLERNDGSVIIGG